MLDRNNTSHHYVCDYCGKHLQYPLPHYCVCNIRKKKLKFTEVNADKDNRKYGDKTTKERFICECKTIRGMADHLIKYAEEMNGNEDNSKDHILFYIEQIRCQLFSIKNRVIESDGFKSEEPH